MSIPKVLMVGAVQGRLEKAFQKISKLHSKQNFSFAIIVGDLFAGDNSDESENEVKSLLNGNIKVLLPTYFTLGDHTLPSSVQARLEATGEVCVNLFFLGRKGTLKTSEGIRIINLGGNLIQNETSITKAIGKYDPLYLEAEAKSLHGAHSADILLTNQWPLNITKDSQIPVPESVSTSSSNQTISNLCLALRPRYHFASSPSASWSREPFMHPSLEGRKLTSYEDLDGPVVTRFTSLGSVETSNKEFMSAFALDPTKPSSAEGAQQTCPLTTDVPKRKRPVDDNPNGYSRYSNENHHSNNRGRNKRFKSDPSSCFMCMSNPDFKAEMVVSIAEESILTVLKGPLSLRGTTFPQLKSSGHIMIIPMYHAADEASHGKRSPQDLENEFTEMTKYRHSLSKMIGSKSLGTVCWEANRTGIRHLHWQQIPFSTDNLSPELIEAAYKIAGEKASYPAFQPCDPDKLIPSQRSDFFRVWIYQPDKSTKSNDPSSSSSPPNKTNNNKKKDNESPADKAERIANGHEEAPIFPNNNNTTTTLTGTEISIYFPLPPSLRFNIGFGREVMAGLLQLEDRSDWRSVESGNGIEEADAMAFKEDYGDFDWAMVD